MAKKNPDTPPQSEQPGRGVNAKRERDYHRIGDTNRFTAPGGLMTVGFGPRKPNSPPKSEKVISELARRRLSGNRTS